MPKNVLDLAKQICSNCTKIFQKSNIRLRTRLHLCLKSKNSFIFVSDLRIRLIVGGFLKTAIAGSKLYLEHHKNMDFSRNLTPNKIIFFCISISNSTHVINIFKMQFEKYNYYIAHTL